MPNSKSTQIITNADPLQIKGEPQPPPPRNFANPYLRMDIADPAHLHKPLLLLSPNDDHGVSSAADDLGASHDNDDLGASHDNGVSSVADDLGASHDHGVSSVADNLGASHDDGDEGVIHIPPPPPPPAHLHKPLLLLSPHDDHGVSSVAHDLGAGHDDGDERVIHIPPPPVWWKQITLRGLVVSTFLGSIICVIIHKLALSIGVVPSLNVPAGLLAFFFVKTWTQLLSRSGFFGSTPFTRQENTVIQTCIVACYGIAFSGGFGGYLLAMDENSYNVVGSSYSGNRAQDVKNPSLGWIIAFVFTVSFVGIFSLVPLRKVMIIDYRLTYPSGTATAILINSFHTPTGATTAKKQVECLGKYFSLSFLWSLFKWFFSGAGDSCGFDNFPTFGLQAFENTFYFDFSLTYIGVGMICPHIVNCSLLLGAVLSWGILWPFIRSKAGDWYEEGLASTDIEGLSGYKIFIAVSFILGDGIYNIIKLSIVTWKSIRSIKKSKGEPQQGEDKVLGRRFLDELFMKEGVPFWVAASGYAILALVAICVIPLIFPDLKWYHVLTCYIFAPFFAFSNAYGTGLTDWNCSHAYGKLVLFLFAAWVGSDGGVIAGLAASGVMLSIVATASDLMKDLKTGHLTASSPLSMFASQILGTALGCILAPLTFWVFWTAFDIGDPDGQFPAPFAVIFRGMALVGVQGFSALPSYCLELCLGFFLLSVVLSVLRDTLPSTFSRYVPIPMAMAIPFYLGAYFAIDMVIGSVIVYAWERRNKGDANTFAVAVASGLISGDGVWTIPSVVLSLFNIDPPICMSFASTG